MSNQLLRIPIVYLNDGNFKWYKKLYSIILCFLFIFFYIILYIIASINHILGNIIYSILTIENVFIFYFGLAEGLANIPLRFLKNMDLNYHIEYLEWKIYRINMKIKKEEFYIYKIQKLLIEKQKDFPQLKEEIDICLEKIKNFELNLKRIENEIKNEEIENKEKNENDLNEDIKKNKNKFVFENEKDLIKIHKKIIEYELNLIVFNINQENLFKI